VDLANGTGQWQIGSIPTQRQCVTEIRKVNRLLDEMLQISSNLVIPDTEFSWTYVRAGGPGGQNVNKVSSKAVLRWNLSASPSIPPEVKARLAAREPGRVTAAGDILISSQRFRDQERNRQDCLEKLTTIVRGALAVPKSRRRTRPTRGSVEARLRAKRKRAGAKSERRRPEED
jgi:ribosome-associated protein